MRQVNHGVALGWPLRLVRVALLTGLTCTLGVGAHTAAAGGLPSLPLLLMCAAAIAGVALPIAQGRLTLPRLLLVVAGGQLGIHLLLTITAHSSGHSHTGADWQMVLAHTAAAALCALGLARGELYFWQLLTLIVQRAQWIFDSLWRGTVVSVQDVTVRLRALAEVAIPRRLVRLPIPVRRGPPDLSSC